MLITHTAARHSTNEIHTPIYIVTRTVQWKRTFHVISYLLTPCSRVLLEKPIGFQLVKKFPAFYGTRKFIIAFTSARHLSLSWASSNQSIPPHPTSWRPILVLSYHLLLGLTIALFPSDFPTKILYTSSPPYVLHAPPTSFLVNNTNYDIPSCVIFALLHYATNHVSLTRSVSAL